jgi:hypothetical protein
VLLNTITVGSPAPKPSLTKPPLRVRRLSDEEPPGIARFFRCPPCACSHERHLGIRARLRYQRRSVGAAPPQRCCLPDSPRGHFGCRRWFPFAGHYARDNPVYHVAASPRVSASAATCGSHVAADFETAIATLKTLAHNLKER